jgi:hypothetical protein
VYIVLDALDECAEQDDLLSFLHAITYWKLNILHILAAIASRPDRAFVVSHTLQHSSKLIVQLSITTGFDAERAFRAATFQQSKEGEVGPAASLLSSYY